MAKVSLIITVYNKAPFLKRCLDSIVNQTDKSAQIILIDDGSTDGSTKICRDYSVRYGWEFGLFLENQGVSAARNLGLEKATGEYIAFLDADDAFTPDAIDIMTRISRHGFNICQFGHNRIASGNVAITRRALAAKGEYTPEKLPKHWQMVWNKLYKTSFIRKHKLRFIEGMQFGEDEIFNVRAILANDGLYHAPQSLMNHYFDDLDSLCRGHLDLERLSRLIKELENVAKKQKDPAKRECVQHIINRHLNSTLFDRFGYGRNNAGKYDVVYFLKPN